MHLSENLMKCFPELCALVLEWSRRRALLGGWEWLKWGQVLGIFDAGINDL